MLNGYVDKVSKFNGRTWAGVTVDASDIKGRGLTVAVPRGAVSSSQRLALTEAIRYGNTKDVTVTVVDFK